MVQAPSICNRFGMFGGVGLTKPFRTPGGVPGGVPKFPTQFALCACAGRTPPKSSNARPSSRMAIQPRRALTFVSVKLVLNHIPLADQSHRQGAETARVSDWSFGSPAVVEPSRLVRPVTLRPHLSVGLPLSCPGSADRSGQIASSGSLGAEDESLHPLHYLRRKIRGSTTVVALQMRFAAEFFTQFSPSGVPPKICTPFRYTATEQRLNDCEKPGC